MKRFLAVYLLGALAGLVAVAPARAADAAIDDYNFAAWLYNSAKYELAADAYTRWLEAHSDHAKAPEARFGLAQACFLLNRFDEAAAHYETLRERHSDFPRMAEVLFQLGQARVAQKQFAVAEALFAVVRESHKAHYLADWALARQGACLVSLDRHAEAAERLRPFVERYVPSARDPADGKAVRRMLARMEKEGVAAGDAFLGLLERSLFYLAIAQFNTEKYEAAARHFDRYAALYPNQAAAPEARLRLAQALYRAEDFAAAAEAYEPVVRAGEAQAPVAAYEQALALYKMGQHREAAAAMAALVERFPSDEHAGRAALYAGTFLYEAEAYGEAAERLRAALAREDGPADEAAYWLGMSLHKAGDPAGAEPVLRAAVKRHQASPLRGDMRLALADVLVALDKPAEAARVFAEYAAADSASETAPRALFSACVAQHQAGDYAASDRLCETFLESHGGHALAPRALFLSGENRFLVRDYQGAAERYRAYLDSDEAEPDRRARARFRLAWCWRHAGRHAEAVALLDEGSLDDAGPAVSVEARYLRGASLFDLERYAAAEKALEAYLRSDDSERFGDDALLKIAVSQSRRDEKQKAVRSFERFLTAYPESELVGQTYYQLAECHQDLKQWSQAADAYRKAAERAPEELQPFALFGLGTALVAQKDHAGGAEAFGALAERFPASDLREQALYRRGHALREAGEWAAAVKTLQSLTRRGTDPDVRRAAWVAIGACHQKQEAWATAAKAFAAARELKAPDAEQAATLYELGWSHQQGGQSAEALAAFKALAEGFPAHALAADAWFHLGEAAYRDARRAIDAGNDAREAMGEAAHFFRKVVDATRDARLADKAWYRLGWCRWTREEYAEAATAFKALVEGYPNSELAADGLYQAGQAYARMGNMAAAAAMYEKLVEDKAHDAFEYRRDALVALGEARLAQGAARAALTPLRAALEVSADDETATRALLLSGKAHYRLGDREAAVGALERVTRQTRSALAAEAQFYIGQALQADEQYGEAVVAYLRVQALYGAYPEWVAGALVEMGKCHEALGNKDEARQAYAEVVKTYGDTEWAALAKERL